MEEHPTIIQTIEVHQRLSDLIRGDEFLWGKIIASCVIAAAPPIVIYAFLMDYYIAGLTAGATKE